jgi:5-methylcytosine-specific restriction endonuclease McrA
MKKTLKALRNEEYKDIYVVDEARMDFILTDYVHESSEDLFRKIELESSKETGDYSSERKRNTTLVKLLKSYYTKLDHDSLKCECCSDLAFITEKNGPYIEFHHLIPFSKLDGPDHYLNLYALCPNCHRKIHFIEISRKSDMYDNLDVNNYLRIDLLERLKTLHKDKLLKSYQMEFLLSEDAIDDDGYNYILS